MLVFRGVMLGVQCDRWEMLFSKVHDTMIQFLCVVFFVFLCTEGWKLNQSVSHCQTETRRDGCYTVQLFLDGRWCDITAPWRCENASQFVMFPVHQTDLSGSVCVCAKSQSRIT